MPTETGCNPPNCLVIPPASGGCFSVARYSQRPDCGGLTFDIPLPILSPLPSFAPNLCAVIYGFRLADGTCAQVAVVNPSPTGSPLVGSNVECPPGFTYDPLHEVCVLDGILIIWPDIVPPPPPPTPPPPSPSGCVPDCTTASGILGQLAHTCFEACVAVGGVFSPSACEKACCIPCSSDPPVPRGRRDVITGRMRRKFDFGRPPFELQHALSTAVVASTSLGNFRLRNPAHQGHKPLGGG